MSSGIVEFSSGFVCVPQIFFFFFFFNLGLFVWLDIM